MVGVNGGKFPAIREHLQANIAGAYKDMDITCGIPSSHLRSVSSDIDHRLASTRTRRKARWILRPVSCFRRSHIVDETHGTS